MPCCGSKRPACQRRRPSNGRGKRAIALSTDGNGRWCALDPRLGAALVVAESALNVACVGARPVALVNCLNFGNPEHPEVMWQLSEAIDGMAEACRALAIPVIGGNVSLYNESRGHDIDPTPVVGTLGLVDQLDRPPPPAGLGRGSKADIMLLGPHHDGTLGGSLWALTARGHRGGTLGPLDLDLHARLISLVAALVNDGLLVGIHDVADGGVGVALAEMAVASGVGFEVAGLTSHVDLFGEAPSRVVLAVNTEHVAAVLHRAEQARVPIRTIGRAGGDRLVVDGLVDVSLDEAVQTWRTALPRALGLDGLEGGHALPQVVQH
ncbi:MAG TPA: AIR synthase related protein [Acidimicrobiales bacterium]|nr:AIR synthase related protein [Acidimicrobiales bacterium]